MQQEVELALLFRDPFEHLLGLTFDADVERHEDRRFKFLRERLDVLLCAIVEIGHREIRTQCAKGLGASPGDRFIVGNADDKSFFSNRRPWSPNLLMIQKWSGSPSVNPPNNGTGDTGIFCSIPKDHAN